VVGSRNQRPFGNAAQIGLKGQIRKAEEAMKATNTKRPLRAVVLRADMRRTGAPGRGRRVGDRPGDYESGDESRVLNCKEAT
jgi:hypothetical protein